MVVRSYGADVLGRADHAGEFVSTGAWAVTAP
jgi:hypothetical protein